MAVGRIQRRAPSVLGADRGAVLSSRCSHSQTASCPPGTRPARTAPIRFLGDERLHEFALCVGELAKAQTKLRVDFDSLVVQKNGNGVGAPAAFLPFFFFSPPKAAPDQILLS